MTTARSRRHRSTPLEQLRRATAGRSTVAGPLRRSYRQLVAGGLAIVLAGSATAAATVGPTADQAGPGAASYLDVLEATERAAGPDSAAVEAPAGTEVTAPQVEAEVELDKPAVRDLREVRAARRAAAERQALAEQQEQQAAQSPSQESSSDGASESQPQAAATGQDGERGTLAGMVNSLRDSNGQAALTRDGSLDAAAQGWAEQMASTRTLQHNPNLRSDVGGGWGRTGENIVRNTGAQSWSADRITSWMFNWWSNSSVHRANMLNDAYTHIGVGYAMGGGGPYAVLVFGAH